jgi:hypothetical protein
MKIQRICEALTLVTLIGMTALFLYSPLPMTEAIEDGIEHWQRLGASVFMSRAIMSVTVLAIAAFIVYFPAKMAEKHLVRINKSKSDL